MWQFLGFAEDAFTTVPTSAGFVADVAKRDAVVGAFKVSVHTSTLSRVRLMKPHDELACMASIR